MVHWGEDADVLGDQQDGSHPGRQALNSVHKKSLSFDLSQILWTALTLFDNDASGCYDQILVALAIIAAWQLGMPRSVCWMQAMALSHM
jgi:hypothetical protein